LQLYIGVDFLYCKFLCTSVCGDKQLKLLINDFNKLRGLTDIIAELIYDSSKSISSSITEDDYTISMGEMKPSDVFIKFKLLSDARVLFISEYKVLYSSLTLSIFNLYSKLILNPSLVDIEILNFIDHCCGFSIAKSNIKSVLLNIKSYRHDRLSIYVEDIQCKFEKLFNLISVYESHSNAIALQIHAAIIKRLNLSIESVGHISYSLFCLVQGFDPIIITTSTYSCCVAHIDRLVNARVFLPTNKVISSICSYGDISFCSNNSFILTNYVKAIISCKFSFFSKIKCRLLSGIYTTFYNYLRGGHVGDCYLKNINAFSYMYRTTNDNDCVNYKSVSSNMDIFNSLLPRFAHVLVEKSTDEDFLNDYYSYYKLTHNAVHLSRKDVLWRSLISNFNLNSLARLHLVDILSLMHLNVFPSLVNLENTYYNDVRDLNFKRSELLFNLVDKLSCALYVDEVSARTKFIDKHVLFLINLLVSLMVKDTDLLDLESFKLSNSDALIISTAAHNGLLINLDGYLCSFIYDS